MLHDVAGRARHLLDPGLGSRVEIDALFVTALLTVIGFSVHDTIVVFDRIRENLTRHIAPTFEETVNYSLVQTMVRSLNTSLTVIFTLLALYLFGGDIDRRIRAGAADRRRQRHLLLDLQRQPAAGRLGERRGSALLRAAAWLRGAAPGRARRRSSLAVRRA